MDEEVVYRAIDHVVSGIEDVIGHHGMHWWMHKVSSSNWRARIIVLAFRV